MNMMEKRWHSMTTIRNLGLLLIIGAFAWALTAGCGSDSDEKTDDSQEYTLVAAPIDDLDLQIRESFPPQYALRVVSGLPNGCHEYNSYELTREGSTINIRVLNRVPSDPSVVCTQVYGQHEEIIDLGSDFETGTEYTVQVNEKTLTFAAQ
jgi:hypothetical protein